MSHRNHKHSLLKLEHRRDPLLPRHCFLMRMAWFGLLTLALIGAALFMGAAGYHMTEGLPWIDAFLNAAMILSGMGPVNQLQSVSGKIFATYYALFSGLVFISVTGLMLGPIAHRVIHRFHIDLEDEDDTRQKSAAEKPTAPSASPNPRGRSNH